MIADILVYIDQTDSSQRALSAAIALAEQHKAQITALYIDSWAISVGAFGADLSRDVIDTQQKIAGQRKQQIEQYVAKCQQRTNVELKWAAIEGDIAVQLIRHAAWNDCVVLGHPCQMAELTNSAVVNTVTLAAGRPVLVIPKQIDTDIRFSNILVAWDGSRESVRAIHDALAILSTANRVRVIAIDKSMQLKQGLHAITEHLQHHQILAIDDLIADYTSSIGECLLETATNHQCDLIVMGCYGHSRLREWVLGGCTRYLLQHTNIPLWLSH